MCMRGRYHHERASRCQAVRGDWVGTRVGIAGWVYGGLYRVPTRLLGEVLIPSGAGPEALQGLEWWGMRAGRSGLQTTHSSLPWRLPGPASLSGPLPRANPASGPIKARIDLISTKLSQNAEVSPKYVQKASHSPYSQNEVQKSPLGILRFPFSLAFSHKELMASF